MMCSPAELMCSVCERSRSGQWRGTGAEGEGPSGGRRWASQGIGRQWGAASLEREGLRGTRFEEDRVCVGGSRRRRRSGGMGLGAGSGAAGWRWAGARPGPRPCEGRPAAGTTQGWGWGDACRMGARPGRAESVSALGQEPGSGTARRQGLGLQCGPLATGAAGHPECGPRRWPCVLSAEYTPDFQELVGKKNVKNLSSEFYRLHIEMVEFFYVSG